MKLNSFFNRVGAFLMALFVMFSTAVMFANQARERNFHKLLVIRPGDSAPFPIDTRLSAIVVAYKNQSLIADQVCPRVPVSYQEFKYLKYNMAEGFTIPDNKIGRKSQVNKVEFSATLATDKTEDYGLQDDVPQNDIDNAPPEYDPLGRATEGIADLNDLNREVRTANLIFNLSSYAAGNQLSVGTDAARFDAYSTSEPIGTIQAALDAMIIRANTMVMGQAVWTKLRSHPDIVSAILGNAGLKGIVNRQQVAALFELNQLLVGQGFLNTSKKGQTPAVSRVWGKHLSLLSLDPLADTRNRPTFSLTAQWGPKVAYSWFDKNIGLKGATSVKAGDSVKELVTASDLGYIIYNAVK